MQLRRVPLSIEFADEPFAMHMGYHIDSFIALWEELYNQVWYYGSFWIKELFAYMGERMEYYKRIRMAKIFLINIS